MLSQTLYCYSTWINNLLTGHTSTKSSISQAIQQLQQDWDQSQPVHHVPLFVGLNVEEALAAEFVAVDGSNPSIPTPERHDLDA